MSINNERDPDRRFSAVVWQFGDCEFDEYSRQLRVAGSIVELESKPIEVLLHLLLHAGEVLTKDELLSAAWPGLTVVEGSLTTAVSKLRKALGDEDQSIIVTVPRLGYKLGVPVHTKKVYPPGVPDLKLEPGMTVPGREQWQLIRNLDISESSEVWLAEHPKTHESRVFKFAADGIRLRGIKREVTLARVLRETLGERLDFVRILEWNFDTPPFYIESEFGGTDLTGWAAEHSGLSNIPLATRLDVLIRIAKAVAAAHTVGVLHKDLKPANVLIANGQVRVADFGSGGLSDPARLEALGITGLGFTRTYSAEAAALTGTILYMAPEVLAGQATTAQADVYSLGVMLYQLCAGDFRKPLSAGWESDIPDALLAEDIAAAASGDPAKRLASVSVLVERLERLDARRSERSELEEIRRRALAAEQSLARARARRPWMIAAGAALTIGLAASLLLYRTAAQERDRANRQTEVASRMNRFLANDLLGRSDPFQSGQSSQTLADAIRLASTDIDRQFENNPEVAARLHHAVARALDNRTEYAAARREYERAAALLQRAGEEFAGDLVVVQLQRAAMEARTYSEGSLPAARSLLEEQEQRITKLRNAPADLPVWLASARGMIALIANDGKRASEQFQAAHDAAAALGGFDEAARLTFKQRLAFSQIRLGNGPRAEQLFRELMDDFTRLRGASDPSVLRVRLNLAQAYMIQNKHQEAVREATAIYPAYVERLGEDHELAMQVLTTRAQSEGSLGLWNDAIRDDLKIHALAVKKQGPRSFFAIATLSDAALAQCRAGMLAEGAANASRAYDDATKAFGPRAGLTGGVGHTLASCWIEMNRLDDASRVLAQIDRTAVAALAGSQDWPANVDLSLAEIAYKKGDFATAKKYMASAAPVFKKPEGEAYQRKIVEKLEAAMAGK
jgi:DNA-binding winged helix-turn-helix (wHTH) protein/serine/threonine protein kinase